MIDSLDFTLFENPGKPKYPFERPSFDRVTATRFPPVPPMNHHLPTERVAKLTGSNSVQVMETIQSLWSGYGEILRVRLDCGKESKPVIVKFVSPPIYRDHKYGWGSDFSHQRKLRSYENEIKWYQGPSGMCDQNDCRVPQFIAADGEIEDEAGWTLILEDLDAAGFNLRRQSVNDAQVNSCLRWLANFHAIFLIDREDPGVRDPAVEKGLWPTGTYWHLQTRPEEFEAMEPGPLKSAATSIASGLSEARFQTLVHGDAKLANFCFSPCNQVAAVDFQYVGGGCGIKDVAYFVSSCFNEDECEKREQEILAIYFEHLKQALARHPVSKPSSESVEREWRRLYAFAWADFFRFLAGWSPGHWKMNAYSQKLTEQVLSLLSTDQST